MKNHKKSEDGKASTSTETPIDSACASLSISRSRKRNRDVEHDDQSRGRLHEDEADDAMQVSTEGEEVNDDSTPADQVLSNEDLLKLIFKRFDVVQLCRIARTCRT